MTSAFKLMKEKKVFNIITNLSAFGFSPLVQMIIFAFLKIIQ
ncbi:hypothetical protein SAMN05421789_102212 [Kaistella chaponensis]|uniref:Uncharacterized protein n=1 Tax=Kaistella chaponensis TaxID=713588 RepID=A0A1N7JMQ4_9FLAO|nr:hypothetical protein SAMN05421789_102212 [Kaistella chaponensis]